MRHTCIAGIVCVVAGLLLSAGCAAPLSTKSYISPSEMGSYSAPAADSANELRESLFKDDQAVMDGKDLERILTADISIKPGAKVAVVRFGKLPYWWGWSEDFTRMNRKIDDDFLAAVGSAKGLESVAYLPSLVTPHQMTIPYLRQAAARCQADAILIYRTTTRTYDRQRMFQTDETKAYCTVEAVLVDTRTGIIPFSTVVTHDFSAKRVKEDLAFRETIARAEQQAIANAWLELGKQTAAFVDNQKPKPTTQMTTND